MPGVEREVLAERELLGGVKDLRRNHERGDLVEASLGLGPLGRRVLDRHLPVAAGLAELDQKVKPGLRLVEVGLQRRAEPVG